MSIYTIIFADPGDGHVSSTSTSTATSLLADTASATLSFGGGSSGTRNYQAFLDFDTSTIVGTPSNAFIAFSNVVRSTGSPTGSGSLVVKYYDFGASVDTTDWRTSALWNSLTDALPTSELWTLDDVPTRHAIAFYVPNLTNINNATSRTRLVVSNSTLDLTTGWVCASADASGTTNDPVLTVGPSSGSWQFVGVSNAVEATTNNITLVETGISGLQAGDLLVACISYRSAAGGSVFTSPGAPWASVAQVKTDNTATTTSAVASGAMFYCVRGASAPGLAFTRSAGANVALGRIGAWRNVAQTSSLDANNSGATTATNTTAVSVAGLTTTQDDDLIVAMFAGGQEATVTNFAAATSPTISSGGLSGQTANPIPNAWLERADSDTVTGADTALSIFDAVKTTTGATGNLTCTASLGAAHVVIAGAFKILVSSVNGSASGGTLSDTASLTGGAATGGAGRSGAVLTATGSLVSGAASAGATATGGVSSAAATILSGAASASSSASGSICTGTASLVAGEATAGAAAAGTVLSATASLLSGTAAANASAPGSLCTSTASLVAGAAIGGTDATASGAILSSTAALTAGAAAGAALAAGVTSAPSATILSGAVGVDVAVSGSICAATGALLLGAASGDAAVSGSVCAATIVFVAGSAAADVSASGAALSATVELVDGSALGDASVDGAALSASGELVDGLAIGDASADGTASVVSAALLAGDVVGDAEAPGSLCTAPATFLPGVASTESDVAVSGVELTASAEIIAGSYAGDAAAGGDLIVVSVSEGSGAASGNAVAIGAQVDLAVSLIPGRTEAVSVVGGWVRNPLPRSAAEINANAPGALLTSRARLLPGEAVQFSGVSFVRELRLVAGGVSGDGAASSQPMQISAALDPGVASGVRNLSDEEFLVLAVAA